MLAPTSGSPRELRQERCKARHTGGLGPRLCQGEGTLPTRQPHLNHSCSRRWDFRGDGPTPPLIFNPPLLWGRARAGGANKGAGAWPGARPGGPSPPPIHRRGSARGAAAAGTGAHGNTPRPHPDHPLPGVHPAPGGSTGPQPGGVSALTRVCWGS